MLHAKLKGAMLVLLAAVILISGRGATPAAEQTATVASSDSKPQVKVKWEYKTLTEADIEKLAPAGSQDKLTDGLNKLGDQGWELVTIIPGARGGAIRVNIGGPGGPGAGMMTPQLTYVFKRPK